jgi:transcriptional regulator with XRE-family HTH domain
MATLSQLAVSNLALKGAGVDYNYINRFFATKAEADAALADNSWTPVAGQLNACLTGDQGLLVYNSGTGALDLADQATRAYIDSQITALVDSSPETLNTLNELAAALNDDPAYFTTAEAARQANTNLINAETSRATAAEAAIQADVDQNEADADAAIAAVQADVDQNEADADAAIAAENAAMLAAVAAVQADVDQNESDADAAIAAVQADVDQNEADADAAIAAVQADVDQNEADADAAIAAEEARALAAEAAIQADVDQNEADADAAIAAVQADVDQNEADADAAIAAEEARALAAEALLAPLASPALTGTPTAPTATAGNSTTQLATTAFVSTAVANLVDNAPGTLDTLNEIATALGNDANLSTTLTNSIAAVQADVDQNELDSDTADAALSARITTLEADPTTATAVAAVQADVDQNEADADAADAALGVRIDNVETEIDTARTNIYTALGRTEGVQSMGTFTGSTLTDNTTVRALFQELETAQEATQADVDQNEADSDAADAALSARIDTLEADPTTATAVAAVQADVDQNEADADAAIAAVQADVDQNEADADAAIAAVQADVDQNEADADAAIALKADSASPAFSGVPTAPTAIAGTNTTQLATTAFVTGAVSDLVNGAPGALDTLNELAAALNDDANAATNLTTLINANTNDIADVRTTQGTSDGDTNLGTFTGSTIADNQTIKAALQALETAQEATQADVDQNESDADTAIAAVQADVDQNEADADAAIAAILAGTSIPGPYNNDAAAATGGVAVGAIYKNSNGSIHWRVS